MSDDYNPNNLGAGGFLAVSACGCMRGWTGYLDNDGMEDVRLWLNDGCTIVPLARGHEITREICKTHAATDQVKGGSQAVSDNTSQPCVHADLHLSGMTEAHGGIGSWYECLKCGERFRSDIQPYKLKVSQGVPAQKVPPVTALRLRAIATRMIDEWDTKDVYKVVDWLERIEKEWA